MKRLVLIVTIGLVCWGSAAVHGEILMNPGFEDGTWTNEGDWPNYWWQWVDGGWAAWKSESLETDPSLLQHPRTGDKCIAVGAWDAGFGSWGQSVEVTAGRGYTLSAWVNTEGWGESPNGELVIGWRDNTQVDEWGNPISLGDTIKVIDFPGGHPGEYVYFEVSGVSPAGANQADIILLGRYSGTLLIDDVSFDTSTKASCPNPADGEGVLPTLDVLSWVNPDPNSPWGVITCDVYFDPNSSYDPENPTMIVGGAEISSVTLSELSPAISLVPEEYYFWRVDCYDSSLGETEEGTVWMFHTFNVAPQVEAGKKQQVWLEAGSAEVSLDATVTDDGLPLDPGEYTLLWTVDSGPGAVVFDDDTVEDPTATLTVAGEYVLRLLADDTEAVGEDTVVINVFEEGYTGLLALWPLDDNAEDIIGGHDGIVKGDAVFDADAQVGTGSVLLDGYGDYIDIQDSGHAQNTTWADLRGAVTLSAWIKVNSFTRDWQAVICKGDLGYRIQRNWGTNGLVFSYDTEDATDPDVTHDVIAWGNMNVNDNEWHHVAGTYNGDEICIYIDGVLDVANEVGFLEIVKTPANLTIGENLEYSVPFNGRIDDVHVYEIGLPADKVLEEFIAGGGSNSCGQVYLAADVNEDCYVNIVDLALMAADWLKCQDVTNPECTPW